MNAYFISGLGADEKIFRRIKLPENFNPIYINWIEPTKNESFESYALRLSQPIDTKEDFILLGVSLGGMIAVEMNKFLSPKRTVIISSAVNNSLLPAWAKFLGRINLIKILPDWAFRPNSFYEKYFLGIQSEEDKTLMKSMLPNVSIPFFHWAIPQIVKWKNQFIPDNLLWIHGTKDRLIPFPKNQNIIPVKNGNHFMVFNKADEINEILEREFMPIEN